LEATVPKAEPVLDVPTIPYSEVEQQQRERAEAVTAAPPRKGKRQKTAPRRRARPAVAQTPKVKRGELGPAILAAVEAKIAEGLIASKALEAVAKERRMTAGAVSANYYRVKRQSKVVKPSGAGKRSAPRAAVSDVTPQVAASRSRRSHPGASGDLSNLDRVLTDLLGNVESLVAAVRQQESAVAEVRGRLDQVRSALG
jgi:hypothetical protein